MRNRTRSLPAVVVVGAVALAGAGVALAGAMDRRAVAYTVGLPAVRVAAVVEPASTACRAAIDVPAAFSAVRLVVGTFGRPGPSLAVEVVGEADGARRASGRVDEGYPDNASVEASVGRVSAEQRVRVCVRNLGRSRVALFGAPPATPPERLAHSDTPAELAVVFVRRRPASVLGQLDQVFARAARFKAGWVQPWTFWALLPVLAVVLPALLARALGAAYASERSSDRSSTRSSPDSPS